MKPGRALWLLGGVVVAATAGWIILDEIRFQEEQQPHISRPLVFEGLTQPDSAGPIQVRFDCPGQSGPVNVTVHYLGVAAEAGRSYANETNEIFLDTVHATGGAGQVITVPAASFDRRTRALLRKGQVEAEIHIAGPDDMSGWRRMDTKTAAGVVAVACNSEG